MTVRTGIQVHFDHDDVRHVHAPAYDTLEITGNRSDLALFFDDAAQVRTVIAELSALLAEMEPEPEPQLIVAWCPAETELDGEMLYCDRARGHAGSHHAPGPDEGSEVAWCDEAAAAS